MYAVCFHIPPSFIVIEIPSSLCLPFYTVFTIIHVVRNCHRHHNRRHDGRLVGITRSTCLTFMNRISPWTDTRQRYGGNARPSTAMGPMVRYVSGPVNCFNDRRSGPWKTVTMSSMNVYTFDRVIRQILKGLPGVGIVVVNRDKFLKLEDILWNNTVILENGTVHFSRYRRKIMNHYCVMICLGLDFYEIYKIRDTKELLLIWFLA